MTTPDPTPAIQPPPAKAANPLGRGLLRSFSVVMIAFILSRVLGLVRDVVIQSQFGTVQRDAYYAAFRIPDTIFLIIVGGAVSSAFIPVYTKLKAEGDTAATVRLTNTLINGSIVLISLLGLLAAFFAPQIVAGIIAPGFANSSDPADVERLRLTIELTRILMLSPIFLGLGGWAQGVLNAENQFALPAFAPISYNIGIIVGALFLALPLGVAGLAWGVVIGAIGHFVTQVPGLLRLGIRWQPRLYLRDPALGAVLRLFGPRLFGQIAFQANFIIVTAFASAGQGWVNAVNIGFTLLMLPFGIFALSLSTVVFPTLAAQFGRQQVAELQRTIWGGVRLLVFLSAISSVLLLVMRDPIVRLLYQRGEFTTTDTRLVSDALLYFSVGLISYAVVEVLTRSFYAMHDTLTPVLIGLATVAVTFTGCLLLSGPLQQGGLALSLVLSTTVELLLLLVTIRRRLAKLDAGNRADPDFAVALRGAGKSLLAAALVGGVMLGYVALTTPLVEGLLGLALQVAGGGLLGGGIYFAASLLLRNPEAQQVFAIMRRRL